MFAVPSQPRDVTAKLVNEAIVVTWKEPEDHNGILKSYKVSEVHCRISLTVSLLISWSPLSSGKLQKLSEVSRRHRLYSEDFGSTSKTFGKLRVNFENLRVFRG